LESISTLQITDLVFTQDNVNRDTLKVSIYACKRTADELGGILGRRLGRRRRCRSAFYLATFS